MRFYGGSLFPTLGVGLLDVKLFKLNSSPRPEMMTQGALSSEDVAEVAASTVAQEEEEEEASAAEKARRATSLRCTQRRSEQEGGGGGG